MLGKHPLHISIRGIIENAWPALLTTVDGWGQPFTRAMNNLHNKDYVNFAQSTFFAEQDEWAFFFRTHKSSAKVQQAKSNKKANVYYALPKQMSGLTLLGTIKEFDDPKAKKAIWVDEWENFFPLGLNDPDYTLLKFQAVEFRLFAPVEDEDFRCTNMKIKEIV